VQTIHSRINLLPLPEEHKGVFAEAVGLVQVNPREYADAVRWLEENYSVEAYRHRHEWQWEISRRADEHIAKSSPSVDELDAMRSGRGFSPPTSWYSKLDKNGNPICDENGDIVYYFDKVRDGKRRAKAKEFDPARFKAAMAHRQETLDQIEHERRHGRPVSQIARLRLAVADLADSELEIGEGAETHARKLAIVAYLLVWHESCKDLGEFGGWAWGGEPERLILESAKEAAAEAKRPRGRSCVLFQWFGHGKREVDGALKGLLPEFMAKVAKVLPLLGKPNQGAAELVSGERVPLTPNEQAFFDLLTDEGQTGPDLAAALARGGITSIGKEEISKMAKLPHLKARGVNHRKGAGYYVATNVTPT